MCLSIVSSSVIGIVVAAVLAVLISAVLAVLISAVILWVIRKKRSGEFTEFRSITTDTHLKISDLKDLQIVKSVSILSQKCIKM